MDLIKVRQDQAPFVWSVPYERTAVENPLLIKLAGWDEESASQLVRQYPDIDISFSAAIVLPPNRGVTIVSDFLDLFAYEATLITDEKRIKFAQWTAYNPIIANEEVRDLWSRRDRATFDNTTNETGLLVVRAVPVEPISFLKEWEDFRSPVASSTRVTLDLDDWYFEPFGIVSKVNEATIERGLAVPSTVDSLAEFANRLMIPGLTSQVLSLDTITPGSAAVEFGLPFVAPRDADQIVSPVPSSDVIQSGGFIFEIGHIPALMKGEVNGDPYFEGSVQYQATDTHPHPLANRVRIYFGNAAFVTLGNPKDWQSWSGAGSCEDEGQWVITEPSRFLHLVVSGYVNCEIPLSEGTAISRAPYIRFTLLTSFDGTADEYVDSIPLVQGDYVPISVYDMTHAKWILQTIMASMADAYVNVFGPKDACITWTRGFNKWLESEDPSQGVILGQADISEAAEIAQQLANLDEKWIDLAFLFTEFENSWYPWESWLENGVLLSGLELQELCDEIAPPSSS
jgi:hypothetical protein